MAWQSRVYRLTGTAPLLMHNGLLASPTNKWARLMKEISSKRAKTDADHEELARLEFFGSLYLTKDGPVLPAEALTAVIIEGAKKERMGKVAATGVFVTQHACLEYDGPRTAEELWADEAFRHQALVRIQRNRVLRTRPMFDNWSAVVNVDYEDRVVASAKALDRWLELAGREVGLLDWRPRFGRFTVGVVR